jgi:hypothetical protein
MEHMRLRDDQIKAFCRRQDVCDATVRLVLDAFEPNPVVASAGVEAETRAFRADSEDEFAVLRTLFEVTRDIRDVVLSRSAAQHVVARGLNMSAQKVRQRLELMGAKYTTNATVNGTRGRGYTNLRMLVFDDDGESAETSAVQRTFAVASISGTDTATTRTRDWVENDVRDA